MSSPLVSLPGGLSFFAGSPSPVTVVSYNITGTKGSTTYYYWIIANYSWGSALPIAPLQVANAPDVLGGGNSVVLNWNSPSPQVQSYSVLRSITPVFPGSNSTSQVGFNTNNTTITDSGGALNTYFGFTPIPTIQAVMYIDGTGPTPILVSTVGQQINGDINTSGNLNVAGAVTASGPSGGSIPSWRLYNVSWDGTNWNITSTGSPAIVVLGAAALTQDIPLFTVPNSVYVDAVRFINKFNVTGAPTTLVLANVGMAGTNNFFVNGATYNLKTAPGLTNYLDLAPSPGGVGGATLSHIGASTQSGGTQLTVTIVATGSNINTIVLPCIFQVAVRWSAIPPN